MLGLALFGQLRAQKRVPIWWVHIVNWSSYFHLRDPNLTIECHIAISSIAFFLITFFYCISESWVMLYNLLLFNVDFHETLQYHGSGYPFFTKIFQGLFELDTNPWWNSHNSTMCNGHKNQDLKEIAHIYSCTYNIV